MLISIVIPTYRRAGMLSGLLDALAPQMTAEVEALVIDNDPAGSAADTAARYGWLRYVHEPRPGVVHARNRGVAEARGSHVLFIDDDEVPSPGWLAAFAALARAGTIACFGRITPRFVAPPPPGLEKMLAGLFSREIDADTGADITASWAYLGTGNAMFDRAACFPEPDPFDLRFNQSGGEDIWMIRGLMARGVRLIWNREGLVDEIVPPGRMTLDYVRARKFAHGQQRVIFNHRGGGLAGWARALPWMGIGLVQAVGFGALALGLGAIGSPRALEARARSDAGRGKLMWRTAARALYGN